MNETAAKANNARVTGEAMKEEILEVIRNEGPCSVAAINKATGFDPWEIRGHCEQMSLDGVVEYKMWRYGV